MVRGLLSTGVGGWRDLWGAVVGDGGWAEWWRLHGGLGRGGVVSGEGLDLEQGLLVPDVIELVMVVPDCRSGCEGCG